MANSIANLTYPHIERRRMVTCRIPLRTQRFIKHWPLMLSSVYLSVGIWPASIFGGTEDTFYQVLALIVAFFGIVSSIFWKKYIFRNIMTSIALARSASVVSLALVADSPLPFSAIMRLTEAGILAVIFFCLAIVEIPHLKAMRHGY